MDNIKYYNFREVSDFFYNLLINNSNVFDGFVKHKNITQTQNLSGDANISVLSNWVPLTELNDYVMLCEDDWDDKYLGFGCLIQASGGHDKNAQEAFIISTSIIQRLKVLLNKYGQGFSVSNEKLKMTIYNIDFASVTDPDNPSSDFALSICRIVGVWKSFEKIKK